MTTDRALERVLRRDRLVVGVAIAALVALSWLYLAHLAADMSTSHHTDMPSMPGMSRNSGMSDLKTMPGMPGMSPTPGMSAAARTTTMPEAGRTPWVVDAGALTIMWSVMMVAMMLPAAAPMITVFAGVHRRRAEAGRPTVPTAVFVFGYVLVWGAFSIAAATAQAMLQRAGLLSSMMATNHMLLAGALLMVAGVFQWTPLKRACLTVCRSPLSFVMSRWREGTTGALHMGLQHGLYCLGCCWALMALLFVAGVMNLVWVAVIAVAVLVEKVLPYGDVVGRLGGVALIVAGLLIGARGVFGS